MNHYQLRILFSSTRFSQAYKNKTDKNRTNLCWIFSYIIKSIFILRFLYLTFQIVFKFLLCFLVFLLLECLLLLQWWKNGTKNNFRILLYHSDLSIHIVTKFQLTTPVVSYKWPHPFFDICIFFPNEFVHFFAVTATQHNHSK